MMPISFMFLSLGLLLMVSSILLLRRAWQQKVRQPRLVGAAWGLFLLAFLPFIGGSTGDWGTAVALCAFMMLGLGAIGFAALRQADVRKPPRAARGRNRQPAKQPFSWRAGGRRFAVFAMAGPLSAIAAIFLSAWVFGAWMADNGRLTDGQVALTLFAWPLVWTVLATFACFDMPLLKRGAIVVGTGVLGAVGTYLTVGTI